jgi:hypothetical protein
VNTVKLPTNQNELRLALGQAIYELTAQRPGHQIRANTTDDQRLELAETWRFAHRNELAALVLVARQAISAKGKGVTALLARNGDASQFLTSCPYFAELFRQGVNGPNPVAFLRLLVRFCTEGASAA